MITYQTYKTVHLFGVFLILMALGALSFYLMNGGRGKPDKFRHLALAHGVGMLLAVLGGFGMIARLRIEWVWPGWVFAKILIWFALGGMLALIPRRPARARTWWWTVTALGTLAAWLAIAKPL